MYVIIKEAVPLGLAMVAAAHASLAAYLKFQDTPEVREWLSGPFYKAVCKVSDEEFERAKQCPDHVVITESSLGGAEVAIAFRPRGEWPRAITERRAEKVTDQSGRPAPSKNEEKRRGFPLTRARAR